jgi:hypothetical protein
LNQLGCGGPPSGNPKASINAYVGAAILNIIHHTGGHIDSKATWFLSFALAAVLLSITGLIQVIQLPDEAHQVGKV